jgi:hypothetical protein
MKLKKGGIWPSFFVTVTSAAGAPAQKARAGIPLVISGGRRRAEAPFEVNRKIR